MPIKWLCRCHAFLNTVLAILGAQIFTKWMRITIRPRLVVSKMKYPYCRGFWKNIIKLLSKHILKSNLFYLYIYAHIKYILIIYKIYIIHTSNNIHCIWVYTDEERKEVGRSNFFFYWWRYWIKNLETTNPDDKLTLCRFLKSCVTLWT